MTAPAARGPVTPPGDPRSGVVEGTGGVRLRTLAWPAAGGAQAAARLVVVHGLGEHALRYDELARHLSPLGIATVAFDQRGHGESGGRRGVLGSFGEVLEDLDRVVEHARREVPGSATFLLGHSLGGLVVLRWLQTRPVSLEGAVLSAPWLGTAAPVPAWKKAASRLLGPVLPGLTLATGVDPALLTRDPARRCAWEEDPLVHDRISPGLHRAVLAAQDAALATRRDPGVPLLFLVPLDDGVADAGVTLEYARSLPGTVEVDALEDGRHEPLNDLDRERVLRRVAGWLLGDRAAEPPPGGRVSS